MTAPRQPPPSDNAIPALVIGGLFSVAAAVEFARLRGGDGSNLITYCALKETGMLEDYLKKQKR